MKEPHVSAPMPKKKPLADVAGKGSKTPRPGSGMKRGNARGARDWQRAYIASLATTGVYAWAAQAAEVSIVSVWRERKKSPEFDAAEKEALSAATLLLEGEAVRRAIHGLRRYKFDKGQPIMDPRTGEQYYELEYSDALLQTVLKGRMPEVYRDKLETTGQVEHTHLTLEELRMRITEARR